MEKLNNKKNYKTIKCLEGVDELSQIIFRLALSEYIALDNEIDIIIEKKIKYKSVIVYIFNRLLSLQFTPKERIEELYYKLLNYTKGFNNNLAKKYQDLFSECYSENEVIAE